MSAWYDAWQGRPGRNGLGLVRRVASRSGLWSHTDKAVSLALEAAQRFDALLLGISGGTVVAALGAWQLRDKRVLAWIALLVLGYALYWSPGRAYGARFYHPLYLVIPVLMAVPLARFRQHWTVFGSLACRCWD